MPSSTSWTMEDLTPRKTTLTGPLASCATNSERRGEHASLSFTQYAMLPTLVVAQCIALTRSQVNHDKGTFATKGLHGPALLQVSVSSALLVCAS